MSTKCCLSCCVLLNFNFMQKMSIPTKEEDDVTIFAVTLIQKTDHAAGIQVFHPEPGSQRDKVWDPDHSDGEK